MATLGDLVVNLAGDYRPLQNSLRRSSGLVSGFVGRTTTSLAKIGLAFQGFGAIKDTLVSLSFPVQLAAQAEQTEVAFSTMLGSAERARTVLADLTAFAAATPFEQTELNAAARSLLAFNVSAEELIPTLRRVGDISSGIGAPIGEIAQLYGKAKVQGRLFMEDINQLTGRGIPIIQELAKQFGVTDSAVRQLVENGEVNFGHLETAFVSLTGEGGKFSNMMSAQSETLGGKWSTLKDNLAVAMKEIGEALIDGFDLKAITDRVIAFAETFKTEWMPKVKQVLEDIIPLVEKLAGVLGTAAKVIGSVAHGAATAPDHIIKTLVAPELLGDEAQNFRITNIGKEWAPEDVGNALRPRIPAAPAPLTPERLAELNALMGPDAFAPPAIPQDPNAGMVEIQAVEPEIVLPGTAAGFQETEQMQEMRREAARLRDAIRTPMEQLGEETARLRSLFDADLIDQDALDRGIALQRERLLGPQVAEADQRRVEDDGFRLNDGTDARSREGFEAIGKALSGSGRDTVQDRMLKTEEKILATLEEQDETLRQLNTQGVKLRGIRERKTFA